MRLILYMHSLSIVKADSYFIMYNSWMPGQRVMVSAMCIPNGKYFYQTSIVTCNSAKSKYRYATCIEAVRLQLQRTIE